jgi:hypothetical protein
MKTPKHRPWLIEHLPGARDSEGRALTTPALWVSCDLVGYKAKPGGIEVEFESSDYDITSIECSDPPSFYYKSFVTALTRLDLLRKLISVGNFRIRNVKTGETMEAETLDRILLGRRLRVRQAGKTIGTSYVYDLDPSTAAGDPHTI